MRKNYLILVVVLLLMLLAACGSKDSKTDGDKGSKSDKLVIVDFGGASSEAHAETKYKPFEEEYGVEVVVESPVDYGKLNAMMESGDVQVDVITADTDIALKMADEGKLEKLDYDVIDKSSIDPNVVTDYTIGNYLSATTISYNDEVTDDVPADWEEFWNTDEFPGSRSIWKYPLTTLEIALLADGVEGDDMYPLDVDRAFESLDSIKGDVKTWWTAGAQPAELLASKDIDYAAAWNGRILGAQDDGAPLEVEYNEAVVMTDSYIIPKGAPNAELAQKYIAFASEAEPQAEFAKLMNYAPTNEDAYDLLSDEEKILLGAEETNNVYIDYAWWAENFDEVNDRFNKWLLE